jgi:hypothetical protein
LPLKLSGSIITANDKPIATSPEIVARLEATVGHSGKNLLEITAENTTLNNVKYIVDRTAGTITAKNLASANAQYNFQGDDKIPIVSGIIENGQIMTCGGVVTGTRCAIAYYKGNNGATYISEQVVEGSVSSQIISIPSDATHYRFHVRKTPAAGSTTVTFTPMLRSGDIDDDTFEPYITPTDSRIAALEARVAALEART